jgi:hypothetical protein
MFCRVDDILTSTGTRLLWDGVRPIDSTDPDLHCRWVPFSMVDNEVQMCVLHDDRVSDFIANTGRWPSCLILGKVWGKMHEQKEPAWPQEPPGGSTIFLDVGAQLGACTVYMLFKMQTARVVVVEPEPRNLFALTSTLLSLPPQYRERVAVLPIAAGDIGGVTSMGDQQGRGARMLYVPACMAARAGSARLPHTPC